MLCLDNYRTLHGRDAYVGQRLLYALRVQSDDAL